MKKMIGLVVMVAIFGIMAINANAQVTTALSRLTNTAMITAMNAASTATHQTNLTTATMYGAVMYLRSGAGVQSIGNLQRYKWVIELSNLGNANASFDMGFKGSNNRLGGGIWGRVITNAFPTVLAPGQSISFGFIISNKSAASNNSYASYLLVASNQSAPQSYRNYMGWGATLSNQNYGGNIGLNTNNTVGWGPISTLHHVLNSTSFYTQKIGMLLAVISGPVLNIKKTVIAISHTSGLYSGDLTKAEPGSIITYRIWVSNSGSQPATNAKVVDTIPAGFLTYHSIMTQGGHFTNGSGLVGGRLVFNIKQASNNKLMNGKSDRIVIRVSVK